MKIKSELFIKIEMHPILNPVEEQTPIPIEYAYFHENGKRDKTRPKQFYL